MANLPNRPLNVQEFLAFAGWTGPDVGHPVRIGTALAYFQAEVFSHELRRKVTNPGYWILPQGNVIKLCEYMQSIDYTKPVSRVNLPALTVLKAYKHQGAEGRMGEFYTDIGVANDQLAIPRDQSAMVHYKVTSHAPALECTASDAYVHWAQARGIAPEYRHGGGKQYIIANAHRYLSVI